MRSDSVGISMDKIVIQLFADILYMKNILSYDEMDHIMNMRTPEDVEVFTEKMLRGEFSAYKRGEIYEQSIANARTVV